MSAFSFVDPPGPFATVETWESYRKGIAETQGLKDKERLLRDADEVIADLKAGRKPDLGKVG